MVYFAETGVRLEELAGRFSAAGYWVTAACLLVVLVFLAVLARRLAWFNHTRNLLRNIVDGVFSLRNVRHIPIYIMYSLGIWLAYFLHFYLKHVLFRPFGFAKASAQQPTGLLGWAFCFLCFSYP